MRRKTYFGYCTHIYAVTYLQSTILCSHDALLIRAFGHNNNVSLRHDLPKTVADNVDDHFLPAVFTSRLAAITLRQISNVLHDALHNRCR